MKVWENKLQQQILIIAICSNHHLSQYCYIALMPGILQFHIAESEEVQVPSFQIDCHKSLV